MSNAIVRAPLCALLCGLLSLSAADLLAQNATPCPASLATVASCHTGTDQNGATYWIAIPNDWNSKPAKTLVMHTHGGPRLQPIKADSSLEDLERFAVTVRQGFAWAGSSYRRTGYGVRMAMEDTENLRKIFIQAFGKPARTILHGQSYGGNVAAKGIELYAASYDGVVITNGLVAGGSRNYMHRADLRAVYQYVCANHPRADEPAYPLWMGLPAGSKMNAKEVETRLNECTGIKLPPAQRTAAQQQRLKDILGVIHVPESSLNSHLSWATQMFQDVTQRFLEGGNPFSNSKVLYHGSSDDTALNRGVQRFTADPVAARRLSEDSDMSGKITVPVLTMHAIDDPIAPVEYEADYREVVTRAGMQDKLQQVFTTEDQHSKLADAEYAALFDSLVQWIVSGAKPTPAQIAARCQQQSAQYGGGCHFDTNYVPKPLLSRVAPRE